MDLAKCVFHSFSVNKKDTLPSEHHHAGFKANNHPDVHTLGNTHN